MSMLHDVLIQTGIYFVVFLGAMLLMNFLTKGYILIYLRVKGSRGKKILIKAFSNTNEWFYLVGTPLQDMIKFNLHGTNHATKIYRGLVTTEMGVKTAIWDQETDTFVDINFQGVDPNTTSEIDGLLHRCINKPALNTAEGKIILLILIGIGLVSVASLYLVYTLSQQVGNLGVM